MEKFIRKRRIFGVCLRATNKLKVRHLSLPLLFFTVMEICWIFRYSENINRCKYWRILYLCERKKNNEFTLKLIVQIVIMFGVYHERLNKLKWILSRKKKGKKFMENNLMWSELSTVIEWFLAAEKLLKNIAN